MPKKLTPEFKRDVVRVLAQGALCSPAKPRVRLQRAAREY